jgi:hypothetical protein
MGLLILRLLIHPGHGIAYLRARQAIKRACCFHPSVPADCRQATAIGAWLGHQLKHDGYRLRLHVRDGRVRAALSIIVGTVGGRRGLLASCNPF